MCGAAPPGNDWFFCCCFFRAVVEHRQQQLVLHAITLGKSWELGPGKGGGRGSGVVDRFIITSVLGVVHQTAAARGIYAYQYVA